MGKQDSAHSARGNQGQHRDIKYSEVLWPTGDQQSPSGPATAFSELGTTTLGGLGIRLVGLITDIVPETALVDGAWVCLSLRFDQKLHTQSTEGGHLGVEGMRIENIRFHNA